MSPWFAIVFGLLNLVVILLDALIRAMAWATVCSGGGSSHSGSSTFVRSGLAHRAAEFLQSGRDVPQRFARVDHRLQTLVEEQEDDGCSEEDDGQGGQADVDMLADAPTALKNYVAGLQAELAQARQHGARLGQTQEAGAE